MTGHTPWRKIRHKAERDWWTEVTFAHRARDPEHAAERVEELIAAADQLGFRFEVAATSPEPPSADSGT